MLCGARAQLPIDDLHIDFNERLWAVTQRIFMNDAWHAPLPTRITPPTLTPLCPSHSAPVMRCGCVRALRWFSVLPSCRYNQDTDFRYPRSDTDLHDADAKDNPKADDPRLW